MLTFLLWQNEKTLNQQTQDSEEIAQSIIQLYETLSDKDKGVRLLGVTVTDFKNLEGIYPQGFFLYK